MRDDSGAPAAPARCEILDLLRVVLDVLWQCDVRCCYWKSTRRLAAVLRGESDLDLLVAHSDQHRAAQALLECGLKPFPSVAWRDHPAIQSFLGYDEPTGRIVHVHLHLRLVVGERLLKNYRLPWEQPILAAAVPHPDWPLLMLDPASEALLLMVRSALELRLRDPIALLHWRAIRARHETDRLALAPRIDAERLHRLVAELLAPELADAVVAAFVQQRPICGQHRLHRRIRAQLSVHRMYGAAELLLRRIGRLLLWAGGGLNKRFFHLPRPWGRRAPGGGTVIAVVGLDGSGKTTLVAAMRHWLGAEVDTLPLYFGTGGGRPSLLLLPFKLLVPLATRLTGPKPAGASHGKISDAPPGTTYSLLLGIWSTVLAVEKRHKLLAARRAADRGMVVVADRFPQDQINDFNDAPLLPRLAHVPAALRRFEADAYALARRLPPDLVIRLCAGPELIGAREPDMDPSVIRRRIAALQELTFAGSVVVNIDASLPLATVIRTAKAAIWQML